MTGDASRGGSDAPESLTARQAALVRSLVAGGEPPSGLDADRLAATRTGLARKRARVVAHVYPALRAVPDYVARYVAWAGNRAPGTAADDGAAFARSLGRELPLAAAVEQVAARRRRWVRVPGGLVVRSFGVRRLGMTSRSGRTARTGPATDRRTGGQA